MWRSQGAHGRVQGAGGRRRCSSWGPRTCISSIVLLAAFGSTFPDRCAISSKPIFIHFGIKRASEARVPGQSIGSVSGRGPEGHGGSRKALNSHHVVLPLDLFRMISGSDYRMSRVRTIKDKRDHMQEHFAFVQRCPDIKDLTKRSIFEIQIRLWRLPLQSPKQCDPIRSF